MAATRRLSETNSDRVQAERFAAIAGLVATTTHELRNPVAQIAGNLPLIRTYVAMAARHLRRPETLDENAARLLERTAQQLSASGRDIEESARRASLVMADLNAISATPLRALEEVDLRDVVERTVRLTPRSPEVRVHCDLEGVPVLAARAGELEQVVVNLIENALDAVASAGTVLVRLRATGHSVRLEVEDDGPGMAPEVLAHATEPFFTTKPLGKGSGLGLAIVSSIVATHQGALGIASTGGSGTRVTVTLPVGDGAGKSLETEAAMTTG
jgi:two-component system sensor histidine kinase HupT/HoxJ